MANGEKVDLHQKASEGVVDYNAQPADRDLLRGGTQGNDATQPVDPRTKERGTEDHTSASGGVHVERPSAALPRTGADPSR